MRLELPFPPSLNTYWRHVVMPVKRGGKPIARVLISEDGRKYREAVGKLVLSLRVARMAAERKLAVRLIAHAPDARARDLDNMAKAALDALTHAGVWVDDSQIDSLHILRGDKRAGGLLVVEIEQIPMALERGAA